MFPVAEWLTLVNRRALYEYDFGDDWHHTVLLEKILPVDKGRVYPVCIGGRRACPPEDCGGPLGYARMLEILGDPEHEEHEGMMTWLGGSFDPESFEAATVRFDDPHERWESALRSG